MWETFSKLINEAPGTSVGTTLKRGLAEGRKRHDLQALRVRLGFSLGSRQVGRNLGVFADVANLGRI